MNKLAYSAIAASLAFSTSALAQNITEDDTKSYDAKALNVADDVNQDAGRVMSNGSPNDRAGAGFSSSNVQFTNEQGDTSVSLAFSLDTGSSSKKDIKVKNGLPAAVYRVSRQKLSVVLTAPIDKATKGTNLFSGDSLVSGTKAKFSFSRFSTNLGDGAGARNMRGNAYRSCVHNQSNVWAAVQADHVVADAQVATFVRRVDDNLVVADKSIHGPEAATMSYEKAISDPAKDAGELGMVVAKACVPSGEDGYSFGSEVELIDRYGDDPEEFRRQFFPDNSSITFWGIDASMGSDDHTYLDRAVFKLPSAARTSWEVGAYYGWINSDLSFSLRGRAVYGQTYKDNDEAEICRTVSIPAGTECIKGPDGTPLRQRSGLVSVEARKLVSVDDGTQIAIAPQITYKTEDKSVGIEVPIYLVPDKAGKLSGGIKAVYNSKGDEFAVGLFVGVPFSIFFN